MPIVAVAGDVCTTTTVAIAATWPVGDETMIFEADGKPIAVLLRGDHEANEGKIRRALGAKSLELASPEVIEKVTGAPVGLNNSIVSTCDAMLCVSTSLTRIRGIATAGSSAPGEPKIAVLARQFSALSGSPPPFGEIGTSEKPFPSAAIGHGGR